MEFKIIDFFEKDSKELNILQQAFFNAPFTNGKMKISQPNGEFMDDNSDIKNNFEMEKDAVEPGHQYFRHYSKNSYYGRCFEVVKKVVDDNYELMTHTLRNKTTDFIFSKYPEGAYYNKHVDSQKMGKTLRTDYSVTLFINDPSEYEGGELCIDVGTHEVKYKLDAGKAIIYPTGVEHRVNTVSSGERHVCVFWIESAMQDVRMRKIYRDVHIMSNKYLGEPDAAILISKKGFELQHYILRHFANYE